MPDIQPQILRRMLVLRHVRLLEGVSLGELAMVAESAVERTFAPGSLIIRAGAANDAVHVVTSGRVDTLHRKDLGPHVVLGGLEALARRRTIAASATARTETKTLALVPSEVRELVEDNFGLMRATIRGLAGELALHPHVRTGTPGPTLSAGSSLGLVERLLLLRHQDVFAGARLEPLAALAHTASEAVWKPGDAIVQAGATAETAYFVVEGSALSESGREHGSGDEIGARELLGELPYGETIVARTAVRALAISAASAFDVAEDNPDFGLAVIANFAEAILALSSIPTN
jgi:CRP-like cAMP-binding protein